MSYVYTNGEPTTYVTSPEVTECPSSVGWIVAFVLFLLVAIGLAIWLLVLYLGGHVGKSCTNRTLTLTGGSITAEGTTITGTWGTLNNENDKVTLYVSEKPFIFNSDGTVTNPNNTVLQDNQVGSNGKINITVKNYRSYYAMMIVTGDDTVNYRVFGPKRVFTQVMADISGPSVTTPSQVKRFQIQDLNLANGAVSNAGAYTLYAGNVGQYQLGSNVNTNAASKSFLVNLDEPTDSESDQILCRLGTGTQTQVGLAYWVNRESSGTAPVLCTQTSTDETSCAGTNNAVVPLENCQWSYNAEPAPSTSSSWSAAGYNQWCLSSVATTTTNGGVKEPLCLARNGEGLSVVNGQINTDTWFNWLLTT